MKANVAVVVGSLRKNSWSRKLAEEIMRRSEAQLACRILEIGGLPLYNEDLDDRTPDEWRRFREDIKAADAVMFVTPEYNRSVPGVLKNALDVGSRPDGKNHWAGKPAAVVSQTPYNLGAFGANHALRQTFSFLDMPVLQQPEMYIGRIGEKFDARGKLTDEQTGKLLDSFISRFVDWIATTGGGPERASFNELMAQRDAIAAAYVNGDSAPLARITTTTDPATLLSPGGDALKGAESIVTRYSKDAELFQQGSSNLKVLQSGSGQLGFWTGIQHARVKTKGSKGAIEMALRVTEVFRLELGEWKLIHRHADSREPVRPSGDPAT